MRLLKFGIFITLILYGSICPLLRAQSPNPVSLQQLLQGMRNNYEGLKAQGSLVQQKKAQKKAVAYNRLPHLNTLLQASVASDNNLEGTYLPYGVIPSLTSAVRTESNLSAISGDVAMAGINWQAVNFGQYKAQNDVAKSDLELQLSTLAKTEYDLNGIATAYYLELIRQYNLVRVQQDNVDRLKDLLASISSLVSSGSRPTVDSMVAVSELSKATAALYDAQNNYAQMQVQLSVLSGLQPASLNPDTTDELKLILQGSAFLNTVPVDTLHHPQIQFYTSMYNAGNARLNLEKKRYYPQLFLDADGWERGSSLSNTDVYGNLGTGLAPYRFNYFAGLTITYDLFNIARKRLNMPVAKFGADAAYHDLQNEKDNLKGQVERAAINRGFQASKLGQVDNQMQAAYTAYDQQLNLYNSGLSSIIELNTTLDYYIRAQKDDIDARTALLKSILNYSLVTNSFNALVQNLKL